MKNSDVCYEFSKFPIYIHMFLTTSIPPITIAVISMMTLPVTDLFWKHRLFVNLETTVTYTRKENNLS